MRNAGYYCMNFNKTNYNFKVPEKAWDINKSTDHKSLIPEYISKLPPGEPFFCVFNINITHQSRTRYGSEELTKRNNTLPTEARHNPNLAPVPPYYPNTDRNLPLRGHKLQPYEGGVRVPLIVHWPLITKPGSECANYVIIEDIFPTFLEMAGISDYNQVDGVIDGESFVPFLVGEEKAHQNRPIFWHYPNTYGGALYFPYSSMRQGDWKLIYQHVERKLELYNLREDLSEKNDLSKQEPVTVEALAKVLSDFLRESKAQMPIDNSTGKLVEYPDEL